MKPISHHLKHPAALSRSHLLSFALVFAVIGSFILIHSLAAPNPNLAGDLNNDNTVNVSDLSILLSDWSTANAAADINADGTVDIFDLSILLSHFGQNYTPTYTSETNFPTPSFIANRTIDVYNQTDFMTAWSNLQPGDQINVHGVTFTGEVTLANKQLADWAQISFDATTKFVGPSSVVNNPSIWIHDDSHIRFYGGDFTSSASGGMAGGAILLYGNTYITMWNFVAHDTGGTGFSMFPVFSVDDHIDIRGEVYDWGHNLSWDPHAEKGSGLHGANIGDADYGVTNSRFAFYAHDGATGAGIEWGGNDANGNFQNNTIYAWCQNLTFVAVLQTGANCTQVWGQKVYNNTLPYVEAENLQGRPYEAGGMYGGQSLATDVVQYGRATNTNLNTAKFGSVHWDTYEGTTFQNVSPLP